MRKEVVMKMLGFKWLNVRSWTVPKELEKEFLQLQHWYTAVESPMNHEKLWGFIRTHCPYPIAKTTDAYYRINLRGETLISVYIGDTARFRNNPAGQYWLWNAWGLLDAKS